MTRLPVFTCVVFLLVSPVAAQNFSVDTGQGDTLGGFPPPGDILGPGFPPLLVVPGGVPGVNVDALSYNALGPSPSGFGFTPLIDFSVDGLASGLAGSAVATESVSFQAETDVFRSTAFGTNVLLHDGDGTGPGIAASLGLLEMASLSPGGVDAFESQPTGAPPPVGAGGIYWSVDIASLSTAPYSGASAADIFVGGFAGGPIVYASESSLGLLPGDELDALQVYDLGIPGVFDAPDIVLFSLDPTSTSLATLGVSPGDILMSGAGGFLGTLIPDVALGLSPGDNLNALSVSHIPEPGTLGLLSALVLAVLARRRRC